MHGQGRGMRGKQLDLYPRSGEAGRTANDGRFKCLLELRNDRQIVSSVVEQKREGIAYAIEPSRAEDRSVRQRSEARPQGQQMGREVAAVHRRNIGRNEWRQRLRVVPVIEVAPIPLQRFHRAQCVRRAQNELSGRKIPKVMRRQVGEQRQPHVGRRGATRDRDRRLLLHVVGRQPMVVRTHIHFEIRPRPARKLAQEL